MKRKHRVVVEITADKPITQKRAQLMVSEILDIGLQRAREKPLWWRYGVTKFTTKEYNRVLQAELRKDWKESAHLYG